MEINSESLKFILGIKVKQFRQQKNLSLKELGARTGMSVSYLSEIEKGKKYPKPEKIIQLAQGLGQSFDDLVSLNLEDENNPVTALLNSPVFQEFPLHQFGITLTDVFDLITNTPSKAGAFVRTLLEIGRNYDMQVEHFLLASLRSYQKMHQNYFEEIEQFAQQFREEYASRIKDGLQTEFFEDVLKLRYNVTIQYEDLSQRKGLESLRSVWIDSAQEKLIVNSNLLPSQQMFVLVREIGYRYMNLKERPVTSSWMKVESFEQVYSNFKVSYFAGALIIPEKQLLRDMTEFFQNMSWNSDALVAIMDNYHATPEMFLHRLSQVLPHHSGMQRLHYLRLQNQAGSENYALSKELNTTNIFVPRGIGGNEHHCRRWVAVSLMKQLAEQQSKGENPALLVAAQRSQFMASGEELFNIAIARPMSLHEGLNSGMTLGFHIDAQFRNRVSFWDDPEVPLVKVNETCERCPLSAEECSSRIAPPRVLQQKAEQQQREENLEAFIRDNMYS